jgi:hypothetical protein
LSVVPQYIAYTFLLSLLLFVCVVGHVEEGDGKRGGKGKRKTSDSVIATVISRIFRLFK